MGSDVSHFFGVFWLIFILKIIFSHFYVSLIVQGKVTRIVSINHYIMKRKVSRSGKSNLRPSAYQPSAPYHQAKPAHTPIVARLGGDFVLGWFVCLFVASSALFILDGGTFSCW